MDLKPLSAISFPPVTDYLGFFGGLDRIFNPYESPAIPRRKTAGNTVLLHICKILFKKIHICIYCEKGYPVPETWGFMRFLRSCHRNPDTGHRQRGVYAVVAKEVRTWAALAASPYPMAVRQIALSKNSTTLLLKSGARRKSMAVSRSPSASAFNRNTRCVTMSAWMTSDKASRSRRYRS